MFGVSPILSHELLERYQSLANSRRAAGGFVLYSYFGQFASSHRCCPCDLGPNRSSGAIDHRVLTNPRGTRLSFRPQFHLVHLRRPGSSPRLGARPIGRAPLPQPRKPSSPPASVTSGFFSGCLGSITAAAHSCFTIRGAVVWKTQDFLPLAPARPSLRC